LEIRLASLFHDISKPETRRWGEEQKQWTFYGHEVLGAKKTKKILQNLKFSNEVIDKVVMLVRWHMFFSDTEQITLSAVRRMIANVGKENIWDLMNVRICDRIGTGRPKEDPYRLRKYHSMIEEAMRDPVSVSMLKIDGKKLMEVLKIHPGPKIGYILHALLDEVLENPEKNTVEYLENRAKELLDLPENELKLLGEKGKDSREDADNRLVEEIRKKHWVK
jgi:putative nucleotidyltransferase with HDIG domain